MNPIRPTDLAGATPGGADLLEEEETPSPPMTPEALRQLAAVELGAEFRIDALRAEGRWGPRFEAEDLARGERVVLTLLAPPADGGEEGPKRFLDALKGAALLDHPHLIPICAYGVSGELRWYAIAAHSDRSLAEQLATSGPLPLPTVKRIAQQLASALDQAHRRGIMHGALTAADVMIAPDGWVRVEGIGIAAAVDAAEPEDLFRPGPPGQGPDQTALASIIRECLSGATDAPLPPDLPVTLEKALARAMRPRPSERFRDLLDLVAALDGTATAGRPIQPTLPIGARARPEGWNELLAQEFKTPALRPRRRWPRVASGAILLTLIGAIFIMGPRVAENLDHGGAPATHVTLTPPVPLPDVATSPAPDRAATVTRPPTRAPAPPKHVVHTPPPRPRPHARAQPSPTVVEHIAERPAPAEVTVPVAPPAPPAPGTLFLNSTPWGEFSIDGTPMGNTPAIGTAIAPGRHLILVRRDGYVPVQVWVDVAPGATVRLTGITLRELTP